MSDNSNELKTLFAVLVVLAFVIGCILVGLGS